MAAFRQGLLLGVSVIAGGVWMAACSTGTDGSGPVSDDGGMDVQETSTTDHVVSDVHASDVVDGGGLETGPDGSGDGSDGNVGCNATNCGGTCCGDKCVLALSCAGCAEGAFFCPYSTTVPDSNGKCVSSCAACDTIEVDAAVACYACGAGNTPAACATGANQCATTTAGGACSCTSAGDAGACPGATQVCVGETDASPGLCLSCGQAGTDGLACTGGKTCSQAASACQ